MTAKCEGVLININRESGFNICILYVYLKNYLIFIYIHVWRGAAIKKAWSSFYSSPCSGVWQTTASSVLLPFCRQRKLTSPPVLLHSPLINMVLWRPICFVALVSHIFLHRVPCKPNKNKVSKLSSERFVVRLALWHKSLRRDEAPVGGCDWLWAVSGRQKTSVNCSLSVLLSVSIITANRFMDKCATRRHLMKLGLQII